MSLQEQLEQVKKDLEDANETIALQQVQLDSKFQELTEMQEHLEETFRSLRGYDEQFDFELQSRLAEKEEELNDEWAEKMRLETVELRQERDKLRQDALQGVLQNAIRLHELNAAWSRNLTAILANTISNQDVSSVLLRLPILPWLIPLIHDYSFTTEAYFFAEVYTGLEPNVP